MMPNVHDPDHWVAELRPLLREIDFALQFSVPEAHKFFTERSEQPNRPLLSNLVRYHALKYLRGRGYEGAKEEDDSWGFSNLPNNGIELHYRQSCIRLRKGIDPPFPMTGASQDFYQQQLFQMDETGVLTNLLVMFNLNADLQYDRELRLMRPESLNAKTKTVKCEWSRAIAFSGVNLSDQVPPEYRQGADLPLGDSDEDSRTGTDDEHGD